jgi:hypothetical protein
MARKIPSRRETEDVLKRLDELAEQVRELRRRIDEARPLRGRGHPKSTVSEEGPWAASDWKDLPP